MLNMRTDRKTEKRQQIRMAISTAQCAYLR